MTVTPRLAFVTVGGTLAFLGLAVLGWGGFASFFSHPARIALAVVTFLLAGAALFTSGNLSPGEREDRDNRWVLIAFGLIGLLIIIHHASCARWGQGPPISPAIGVQPCGHLIEPVAESFGRNADPDPDGKPALGISGGFLRGFHEAARR